MEWLFFLLIVYLSLGICVVRYEALRKDNKWHEWEATVLMLIWPIWVVASLVIIIAKMINVVVTLIGKFILWLVDR